MAPHAGCSPVLSRCRFPFIRWVAWLRTVSRRPRVVGWLSLPSEAGATQAVGAGMGPVEASASPRPQRVWLVQDRQLGALRAAAPAPVVSGAAGGWRGGAQRVAGCY